MNTRLIVGAVLCLPFFFFVISWTVQLLVNAIFDRRWDTLAFMISALLAGAGGSLLVRAILEGAP